MKFFAILFSLLFISHVCLAAFDQLTAITDENIEEIFDSFPNVFLVYYNPWDAIIDDFEEDCRIHLNIILLIPYSNACK